MGTASGTYAQEPKDVYRPLLPRLVVGALDAAERVLRVIADMLQRECLCDGALSNAAAELPRGDLAAARLATEQMLQVCLRRGEAAQRGMAAADAPAPAVDGGRAAAAGTLESADLQRRAELLVQLRRTLCNVHRRQRVKVCAHLRLADPHSAKAHCLASAAGSVAPRPPRIPRRGIQRPQ